MSHSPLQEADRAPERGFRDGSYFESWDKTRLHLMLFSRRVVSVPTLSGIVYWGRRQGCCQAWSVRHERAVWLWHSLSHVRAHWEGRMTVAQTLLLTFPLDTGLWICPGQVSAGEPWQCHSLSALAARDTLLNLPPQPQWHLSANSQNRALNESSSPPQL